MHSEQLLLQARQQIRIRVRIQRRTFTLATGWSLLLLADASSVSSDTGALYVALEKASAATPRLAVSTLYTGAGVVDAVETVEAAEVVLPYEDADAFEAVVLE